MAPNNNTTSLSANDYILRVSAGPGYDESKMVVVNVNDEHNPVLIDSDDFCGYLVVRMLNFNGVTPSTQFHPTTEESASSEPGPTDGAQRSSVTHPTLKHQPIANPSSNYFNGRNRRYSIMAQGKFKKSFGGDDVIFGIELNNPVRLPSGFPLAIKIAQWLDPALRADLQGAEPWMNSPWLCAMNALAVYDRLDPELSGSAIAATTSIPPTDTHHASPRASTNGSGSLGNITRKHSQVQPAAITPENEQSVHSQQKLSEDIGPWIFHSRMISERTSLLFDSPEASKNPPPLTTYEKRKKLFADVKWREKVVISPEKIYAMDFYDAYFDFNNISFRLPGFNLNAIKYFDGQKFKFVARSRDGEHVFFVIMFELLERSSVSNAPVSQTDLTDSQGSSDEESRTVDP